MPQDGEIDLKKVKALYSIPDVILCDLNEIRMVNEHRTTFELSFAIGLTFFGAELSKHNLYLAITTGAFILFGLIALYRYSVNYRAVKNRQYTLDRPSST